MEDNKKIREIYEAFDGPSTFEKDKYGNYEDAVVHNIWVGFKNWYLSNYERK